MLSTVMTRATINQGRQLRISREYRGFSQIELCAKVKGVSQPNLSKFEKGYGGISNDKLKEIMEVLNWNHEWLDVRTPQPSYCR